MIPKGKIHTFIFTQKPPWLSHSKPLNGQRIIILPAIHIFKENFESFQARKSLKKLESSKGLKRLKCSKKKKVYERGNTSVNTE